MELTRTITSIFFVPTLSIDRTKLKDNGFVNAYIKDGRNDVQYENSVYLLFHPKNIDRFKVFLDDEYERTKSIVDDYDYGEGFVVIVYKLDERFKSDFGLVKLGKYSKTSPQFQSLFPKIIKIMKNNLHKDEISLQYRIFNKTNDLKQFWEEKLGVEFTEDMEVWQGWIEEKEILHDDKIKNHVQQ
jgi:hypothetical protein